jgi:hypothetical protein
MACKAINALPSGGAPDVGVVLPGDDTSNITRKYTAGNISVSGFTYDATITYPGGIQLEGGDGSIFLSLQTALNKFPEDEPTFWQRTFIPAGPTRTLSVPDVYATIQDALDALALSVIAGDEPDDVVIQVEDGAYNLALTQIRLAHPYGGKISILGNVATPASCSLSFAGLNVLPSSPYLNPDSGCIYADAPSNITIDGFSILKTGGAPSFGECAILASNGAVINVGVNMIINGFYADVAALNGGEIYSDSGLALTTVAGGYGAYCDNGTIQIPGAAFTGAGDAISITHGGFVRANDCTVDAAIGIAYVLNDGRLESQNATVGNVDTFFEVSGNVNAINDGGTTYGTAGAYEIGLSGTMNYNGAIVTATAETFARTLVEANTPQHVTSSTESVFLSPTGVDTNVQALALKAGGTTGVSVATTGATSIPVSLALGSTSAHTGLQGGTATLDGAGSVVVAAAWVTANTKVIVSFGGAGGVGPLRSNNASIVPSTSFAILSDAGAADSGQDVNWIAIVYP